ncbi:MAG TPA: DUF1569 domain-containing protein [Candidatus Acidoferrales bacterium]
MKKTLSDAANRSEVLARLKNVRSDSARKWGRMSPQQMLRHLNGSFRGVMSGTPLGLVKVPLPRPMMRWLALDLPMKWPHGTQTRPENDQVLKAAPPAAEFSADVSELETLVARFTRSPRDFQWHAHPFFGEMSDADWMRWGYLHMDHHFRQFGV